MNAHEIKIALESRFSKGNACFREFRTITGYGHPRYIDFLAVGMWETTWGIKSFEIKVSRADFFQDIANFENKHRDALEISHEFYYVCPWGMIDKTEVPEVAGLFYCDKSRSIKKKKQASRRDVKSISMPYFAAFAREFGNKIEHTKIPIKYLGREISQDDFMEFVEKQKGYSFNYEVEKKAKEIQEKLVVENEQLSKFKGKIKTICNFRYFDHPNDEDLLSHINEINEFSRGVENIKKALAEIQIKIKSTEAILQNCGEMPE